jgi:acyl-CoA synthetase (AMP-forming)/AMP-acid ligase II
MIDPDAVATLSSTSGTSGLPKMAARTYAALLAEASTLYDKDHEKPYGVRRMFCTPIFHAFSAPMMLMAPLKFGNPTYFMKRYDDTFASKVFQFGITELCPRSSSGCRICRQSSALCFRALGGSGVLEPNWDTTPKSVFWTSLTIPAGLL